jgi:hypothetical protein
MELKVIKTKFPEDFKESVKIARYKGVTTLLNEARQYIAISCYMNSRPVGHFLFEAVGDKCILRKKLIIENEFYPFEIAIIDLIAYCKKKKIKTIEY